MHSVRMVDRVTVARVAQLLQQTASRDCPVRRSPFLYEVCMNVLSLFGRRFAGCLTGGKHRSARVECARCRPTLIAADRLDRDF